MNGLCAVNVELTSRCNKEPGCFMCGRRKLEREHPEKCNWGDMSWEMVNRVACQIPEGIVVQLHNNGEPLLYPWLGDAISLFQHCITGLNTNAKLLTDKAHELRQLNSLTISIIPNDPEGEDQLLKVQSYLESDVPKPPIIVFRFLAPELISKINPEITAGFGLLAMEHNIIVCERQLHAPEGSYNYYKKVTIPEMGICLEALHKLSIDRFGNVSPCVRFDPDGEHILESLVNDSLEEIWNSEAHRLFVERHLEGRRQDASPICAKCDFWGVPSK